jgi:hypothetical protein
MEVKAHMDPYFTLIFGYLEVAVTSYWPGFWLARCCLVEIWFWPLHSTLFQIPFSVTFDHLRISDSSVCQSIKARD